MKHSNLNEEKIRFPEQDNVGLVEVVNGKVIINLSKNGLLGFAQQLLKLAIEDFQEGYHVHVDPCEENHLSQTMGFYSLPESSELIICCAELGEITKYLKIT